MAEELLGELAAAKAQIADLRSELSSIYSSEAWRLVSAYRHWISAGRDKSYVRLIDLIVRLALRPLKRSHTSSSDAASHPAPQVTEQVVVAAIPEVASGPPLALTGRLIVCPESAHGDKVFYVENDRRHWVPSEEHLVSHGRALAEVVRVSAEEITRYYPAGDLPRAWPESAWRNPPRTSPAVLREIAASQLRGSGIEFGGGTHPFCIPLDCVVKFADFLPEKDLRQHAYAAQLTDFVPLSYVMSLEEMNDIDDVSLDFIVACHVIEHLRNPLRALEQAYAKLRSGGNLVLVVPDKRYTFDKDRELTTLEHLILDYHAPCPERDLSHYQEFFSKVYAVPEDSLQQHVRDAIACNRDIHFHTWTYDTFQVMVEYCQTHMSRWTALWSQPPIDGLPESHEFYFVLRK